VSETQIIAVGDDQVKTLIRISRAHAQSHSGPLKMSPAAFTAIRSRTAMSKMAAVRSIANRNTAKHLGLGTARPEASLGGKNRTMQMTVCPNLRHGGSAVSARKENIRRR